MTLPHTGWHHPLSETKMHNLVLTSCFYPILRVYWDDKVWYRPIMWLNARLCWSCLLETYFPYRISSPWQLL